MHDDTLKNHKSFQEWKTEIKNLNKMFGLTAFWKQNGTQGSFTKSKKELKKC